MVPSGRETDLNENRGKQEGPISFLRLDCRTPKGLQGYTLRFLKCRAGDRVCLFEDRKIDCKYQKKTDRPYFEGSKQNMTFVYAIQMTGCDADKSQLLAIPVRQRYCLSFNSRSQGFRFNVFLFDKSRSIAATGQLNPDQLV